MARRRRPARYFHILLWTIVLGFTIAAGAIFYKAFQEGTENRTKAVLEGTSYYSWTFNRPSSGNQDWQPTNLTLSFGKDKGATGYLQGIVGSGDTVASLSRTFTDGKVLPAGVKKLTISMAVLPAGYATIQKQQTMSQSTPVSSMDEDGVNRVNQSPWSRIKSILPRSGGRSSGQTEPSVQTVEQVKDVVSRYCPLPESWYRLSDEQKMLVDPDPYWCMKPTPVPVTPGPVPCPWPSDWPATRNGQEIMMYPRPDWCLIKPTPTPPWPVPGSKYILSMEYQPAGSGMTVKGTSLPIFPDGQYHEYSMDLDSLNNLQLSLIRFNWHKLPKDSIIKINWIRVTGKPWPSTSVFPTPTDKDGCYTIGPTCKPGQLTCPKMPVQRICPTRTPTPTPSTCYWGMPPCPSGRACTQQMQWICPVPTSTPTPTPPVGCYYQDVQCIKAPCNPVLVCPVPNP